MAPILPYTSEEVYKLLNGDKKESIHLENFPVIGKSLEAKVLLNLLEEDKKLLTPILPNLKQLLIVSDVVITADNLTKYDYCEVGISKFNGVRCERCWNYFNETDIVDDICPRCHKVINEK